MKLNEINFSFGGLHCLRDFGAIYVEKSGHPVTPAIRRNEYEISGMPGSIAMPGDLPETLAFSGSLYFLSEPPTQAAAQERLRRMAAWLTNGRKRLIFDYEPDRFYMASVDQAMKWGFSGWIGGGLDLAFEAQPYAYAVRESKATANVTDESAELALMLDTGLDAPLAVTVENTGTAPITGVAVTASGKQAIFSGMSMDQGKALLINMEPPIGAVFSSGESALPFASRFDILTAARGVQTISVALAYGSGTKGATVTARARGRWI